MSATVPEGLTSSLRVANMRLSRRLRQQGQRDGLTPTQLAALSTVDRLGPLTLGELAQAEKVQPPSMTRVVSALELAGYVERSIDPSDARVARVSMTAAGRKQVAAIRSRRDEWLEDRLRALSAEELDALRRAVAVLQALADS